MGKNKTETPGGDIKELVVHNNALAMEIKDLYERVSDLRISEKTLKTHLKNERLTIIEIRSKLTECEAEHKMAQERLHAEQQERLREQERVHAEQQKRLREQERVHAEQQERLKIKINTIEKKNIALNTSYSFRIGQAFVIAIVKPGKNTILLPFRLVRLIFESAFASRDK